MKRRVMGVRILKEKLEQIHKHGDNISRHVEKMKKELNSLRKKVKSVIKKVKIPSLSKRRKI